MVSFLDIKEIICDASQSTNSEIVSDQEISVVNSHSAHGNSVRPLLTREFIANLTFGLDPL